ncbi:3-isopropylmalate dehydrogenase [Acidocella aminolytica]|jgi:3-isopropylmalate dehydrogenase|uniref:3-isopropylmalate dehydrogenase n=1 Tax=Acidocella aminolytica 101 = DSM 11237 TaxID=1120923 RepID=A0A0D6PFX8_9PROT|nr:3-isopropylmalate dehydrogenase [Acidocella aminolytica]GAN80635.1 3-isopropylmalate/isocitrate dehydrogenase [Acidocella aminolytica 101 = DSM 11237]GBQ40204.1 3-isopropylmalate dehydrogenase [Acidocella aminolytica 101 = DSM 11237]SHE55518.1 3-isopropylmalate dehydrogenase [Acidocella aminolytica 101 = DSM 11237]
MIANKNLLLMPGDGIGPEVMTQAKRVLNWLQETKRASFNIEEELVGGASIDAHGVPLTDAALAKAKAADAVLFGSVGGPKWDKVPFNIRPEAGLLKLRSELQVFANLRPAKVFDALAAASSLKPDLVRGLDIMIVRECIGGIYFGEPRGIETLPNGEQKGVNTEVYTTHEIQRVGRVAFELARKRQNRVCSVEKANVMEAGLLWRQVMTKLKAEEFPDVELSHMYADNCAMQLAKNPKQFDVIVTGNLFGDILSDLAAMLTGSLGLLPSATLGAKDASGRIPGFYEPIHGSAPDIAGKGVANPLAEVLSLAMLLRYSFDMQEDADAIEAAVERVLAKAGRTPDIKAEGRPTISTSEMGDALIAELRAI